MYIPPPFRVDDPAVLAEFIEVNSFATLITYDGKGSFATHLPFLFHPDQGEHGILSAHMARANPQWRHFANGGEALIIFQGPHAYISPAWYESAPSVPTWNYTAVHAYGIPSLITEPERLHTMLDELVRFHEAPLPEPWTGDLPEEFRAKMMQAIVGFEIPVSRIDGKFKLGQNRSVADQQSVCKQLAASASASARDLAALMDSSVKT